MMAKKVQYAISVDQVWDEDLKRSRDTYEIVDVDTGKIQACVYDDREGAEQLKKRFQKLYDLVQEANA